MQSPVPITYSPPDHRVWAAPPDMPPAPNPPKPKPTPTPAGITSHA